MNLGTAKITEIKANALLALDKFFTKRLNSNDEKSIKIVQTISYWILDYVKFLTYESNNNMKFKRYKRGDVIKVNFGHRIGREHGGLHYAIVLDVKNPLQSNLLTVVPLTSVKEHTNLEKLGKDRIFIGNEIYKEIINKTNRLPAGSHEKTAVSKELARMKTGSIVLIGQITTISKYRIYDPLSSKNALHGIKVSDNTLTQIDEKIKILFTNSIWQKRC